MFLSSIGVVRLILCSFCSCARSLWVSDMYESIGEEIEKTHHQYVANTSLIFLTIKTLVHSNKDTYWRKDTKKSYGTSRFWTQVLLIFDPCKTIVSPSWNYKCDYFLKGMFIITGEGKLNSHLMFLGVISPLFFSIWTFSIFFVRIAKYTCDPAH